MTDMPRITPGPAADVSRLVEAATQAMTDSMVERFTTLTGNVLEVADRLNDEHNREALIYLIESLGTMHRTGSLQTLVETVSLLHAIRNAATDSMVERFFHFMEHMINTLGTEEIANLAHETKAALEDALEECVKDTGSGLMGTLRMLQQPQTQQALRFMLAFSCKLRGRVMNLKLTPDL
jgi:uncharacterized protein YjgD (DUF1641 family)